MTALGRSVMTLGLLLAIAGVGLGNPDAACVGLLLLMPVALARVWFARRREVAVIRSLPTATVTRGEPLGAKVTVQNPHKVRTPALSGTDHIDGERVRFELPGLSPHSSAEIRYEISTARRGAHRIGPIEISAGDAFGFARRTQVVKSHADVFVVPMVRTMTVPQVGSSRTVHDGTPRRQLDGSAQFHALREYAQGDDQRSVHWKSSARTGTLMVKQHVDFSEPDALVVIDVHSSLGRQADFEELVDLAASLADSMLRAGFPIHIVTNASTSWRFAGREAIDEMLTKLASINQVPADDLIALDTAVARCQGGIAAFFTTDRLEVPSATATMASKFGAIFTFVIDSHAEPSVAKNPRGRSIVAPSSGIATDLWNGAAR